MTEGPLRGRPWSARMPEEKAFVRRVAGPNRAVGLMFDSVPDGAGGWWVLVEWGRNAQGRPVRKQHRPHALEPVA